MGFVIKKKITYKGEEANEAQHQDEELHVCVELNGNSKSLSVFVDSCKVCVEIEGVCRS